MILHCKSHVTAKQVEGVEFAVFVVSVAGSPAEADDSREAAPSFKRGKALEQFRSNIPVGTEEDGVGRRIEHDRGSCRSESVNVFWEERNEGGIRHESESQRGGGTQYRRLFAKQKESAFA